MVLTEFETAIERILRSLQPGDVVTYGDVAAEAGRPGAARAVGRFLATNGGDFAWWRVVAASGRLAPGKEDEQGRRLRAEGVHIDERRGRVAGGVSPRGSSR